jgi:hypothetical protein
MKRTLTFSLLVLLLATFAFPSASFPGTQALAASGDHFRPSSPTPLGPPADELSTPADYEAAAAANPLPNSQILVSRCRFAPFTGQLYGSLGSNVSDAIVGDTTFPLAGNTVCYNPQNESNIVINPTDSNNVVTAANEYRIDGHEIYTSFDGGATWANVVLPGWTAATGGTGLFARQTSCGDPVLVFAPDGTLYYSGLVCNQNLVSFFSGVAVAASHDGGLTWGAPNMVKYSNSNNIFQDKEFMTVGSDGTIYLTWTRFTADFGHGYTGSAIVLAKSNNGGQSWNYMGNVSDPSHPYNQGSFPLVAPDGTLYVAYEGNTPSTGYAGDAIIVARSTNGGKSFTNSELARAFDDYNCYPLNQLQGRQTLSGEEFRINSFPSFAIDPTNGQLAIVWADNEAMPGCGFDRGGAYNGGTTSNQVKLITSNDGLTWTSPRVITTGPEDKVYPAVGANNGRIYVAYYTRVYSPDTDICKAAQQDTTTGIVSVFGGPVCLDFAARSSTDNFASETRLTTESSNPYISFAGGFIGDYNGAAVSESGSALAVWADFRGNPGVTLPNMDTVVARGQ